MSENKKNEKANNNGIELVREAIIMEKDNHKKRTKAGKDIDGGPIPSQLESDNAFSDKGLENLEFTNKAVNQKSSKRLFD